MNSIKNIIEDPINYPTYGETYYYTKNKFSDPFYDVYFENELCCWFFKIEKKIIVNNEIVKLCKYFDINGDFKGYFYI